MTRSRFAAAARAIAGFLGLLVVGAIVIISTGAYNVAASTPHTALTHWLMHKAMERSVAARADEIPAPPVVDSAMVRHGFEEFHEMCVVCHGAPGVERGALGKGMAPKPPDLSEVAAEWSDRELFWITKHGIKLAGMPAFGVTHSDEALWGIVAFLRRLQDMSPTTYRQLAAAAGTGEHAGAEEPHASAGAVKMDRRMDRGPAHAHTGAAATRAGATAPAPRAMPGMEHGETQSRPSTAERSSATAASGDANATEKLKTLAVELLRDPVVAARIRADSSLRRRWESSNLSKQPARPPR